MKVLAWTIPALSLLYVGCATPITAGADHARDLDLTGYRTFTWSEPDGLPTGDPRLDNNPFFVERLHEAIEEQMSRRGIREHAEGADLLVHHHTAVRNHIEVYEADRREGWVSEYGEGTQVVEYEEGTFLVDIADARTKEILWRGWALAPVGTALNDPEEMQDLMRRALELMFLEFPVEPDA